MKIAVVSPSPVPFTIGGIENMMWGLCDTINQKTEHQCELIKLPSREHSFWDLIDTYHSFYRLDVSHFDMVIYSKYPAWMIQHPNGICYMAHCLRGLYDTYHLMNLPLEVPKGNLYIDKIIQYMDDYYCPESLDDFFELVYELKQIDEIPESYYQFPGPLIRRIVMYMDRWGLSMQKTKKYFSISKTVKERKEYFPPRADVQVLYPPSTLKDGMTNEYNYLFFVSRLDGAKRIDMLIRAMKYVKSDIKLFIAGTGPERDNLEVLAQGDKRIEFLGFLKNDEVEQYYSNSLVIPYFPYDEDYGLITIEAMLHKKPVLTTKDAGGPTEFVHDFKTGFVVDFDEAAIAEKIDYFAQNVDEAKRMGEAAYEEVKNITWESVVDDILSKNDRKEEVDQKRKKITVTSTFPIVPVRGGGQARIFNLYKNIAKKYDVEIISFTNYFKKGFWGYIEDGIKEKCIPQSKEHFKAENELEKKVNVPISDIALITQSGLTQEYGKQLLDSISTSDLVIVSHPYLYYEVKKNIENKPFIYEAHNVEYLMKEAILPDSEMKEMLLQQVFDIEQECCKKSLFIMTCSEEDRKKLCELYHVKKEKIVVVPNGVDTEKTQFTNLKKRLEYKSNLNVSNYKIGLFMGSWHGPNLEACERIFEIAQKCPDTVFLLMGSQCQYFEKKSNQYTIPVNVGLLGMVSEEEKTRIFNVVDFALNPMMSGSGTNLKMFDYMAAGIPVITTKFGARGITDTKGLILAEIDEMAEIIQKYQLKEQEKIIENARRIVKTEYDWSVIAQVILKKIDNLI